MVSGRRLLRQYGTSEIVLDQFVLRRAGHPYGQSGSAVETDGRILAGIWRVTEDVRCCNLRFQTHVPAAPYPLYR